MGPLSLAVPLSEENSGNRRSSRRRRRRRSGSNDRSRKETSPSAKSQAVERALARFSINPLPMGIPKDIDPPPKRINIQWRTNAVSKEVQRKAGEIACIPGEFGFLPEERVQEIASKLDNLPITLEQTLSLCVP